MNGDNYEDIINLPHYVTPGRQPMSMSERAAQFSPFAALTGHDVAIAETARLTDSMYELSEDELRDINEKLAMLNGSEDLRTVTVEYFIPDKNKEGGAYSSVTGVFKRTDESDMTVVFNDGRKIKICNIYKIIFNET